MPFPCFVFYWKPIWRNQYLNITILHVQNRKKIIGAIRTRYNNKTENLNSRIRLWNPYSLFQQEQIKNDTKGTKQQYNQLIKDIPCLLKLNIWRWPEGTWSKCCAFNNASNNQDENNSSNKSIYNSLSKKSDKNINLYLYILN